MNNNLLTLLILIIMPAVLNGKEFTNYKISYLFIENDIRYEKWGVHPVDIRSRERNRKRPIDGAKLAIKETEKFKRLSKTVFNLNLIKVNGKEDLFNVVKSKGFQDSKVILLDLDDKQILRIKNVIEENKDIIFFNISSSNNKLRKSLCIKNLFHTYPSDRMLTDAISQYATERKWNKALILTGPLKTDVEFSQSFKTSAKNFGLKVVEEKFFVNNNDPRVRDKNDLKYLTQGRKYKSVFVSDVFGEFALKVSNATVYPAMVSGSAGLVPSAWHWSNMRYGSPQLNGRFERLYKRRMESRDWAAWAAVKTMLEAIVRTKNNNIDILLEYIYSDLFKLDGSKGVALNYRKWSNQLRQPIFLVSNNNWITAKAPLENFSNRSNNLDTIGLSKDEIACLSKDIK